MKLSKLTTSLVLAAAFAMTLMPAMAQVRPIRLTQRNEVEAPNNNNQQAQQTIRLNFQDYVVLQGNIGNGDRRDVIRFQPPLRMIGNLPLKMSFQLTGNALGVQAYMVHDANRNGQYDVGDTVMAQFSNTGGDRRMQLNQHQSYLLVVQSSRANHPYIGYQAMLRPIARSL